MSEIKKGILHCHSDESIRDSAMTVEELVKRAKELGAPAVALTDHGSMTGYIKFINECGDDIKPIVGVEAYVEENNEGRRHMILMACDYQGFQAIAKAVSKSNERAVKMEALSFPRMNKDIITECFGENSPGHGHVIATSACISGILASLIFVNDRLEEKIDKMKKKQADLTSPESNAYKADSEKLEILLSKEKQISSEIRELKKLISKSTITLEKRVQKNKEVPGKYPDAEKALEEALNEKEKAKQLIAKKEKELSEVTKDIPLLKEVVKRAKKEITKWEAVQETIDELEVQKIKSDDIDSVLVKEAKWYENTFGKGYFFIELQNHGMEREKIAYQKLAELSDILDIPVVISNDAHIPDKSYESILARAIMKTTAFDKWEDPTESDKELYIKTDEELISKISEIIPREKVMEGYENIGRIVDMCNIQFPNEKHYPKFIPPDGMTPAEYLKKITYDRIYTRYTPEEFDEEHRARMEHELDVIIKMGYADYHCLVEDMLRYARAAGKLNLNDPDEEKLALSFDIEKIEKKVKNRAGECVGPGRGSAAGSIVCYIIGITNIDPIKYGLLFERFLNTERVSMPDIDCDIETNVRPYVIQYVRHKYGQNAVCGIINRVTNSGKAAIRTAARVYGIRMKNKSTEYNNLIDEIGKKITELAPDELHINIKNIKDDLMEFFSDNRDASEIIKYASLIEGTVASIGQHAAGIIITDGNPVSDYVPMIYSHKNKIMMTQCDMTQAEQIGLLKVDFLGLNNLTIITETVKEIQKNSGKYIDMDKLPFESAVFKEIFSKAMTNSVFQFESIGMKNMLKNFKPDSIFDLILLVAMYRPGPLQFLEDVIAVKNGRKEISFLTPKLKSILESTYGSITYQEQVQEIFKQLAGYSLGQADLVRRAMSKKKEKVLQAEREAFLHGDPERNIKGCVANGISEEVANTLFDEMTEFAKYAFNKSHAACYAIVAYQTAWLKYHYPVEYMKSVLNNVAFDKYPGLFDDLRSMRIPILIPDINKSDMDFSIEDKKIRYGLSKIKGLGNSVQNVVTEREVNGVYKSLSDFIYRCCPSKTIYETLTETGAFDSFCANRLAVINMESDVLNIVKAIKKANKDLSTEIDDTKKDKILKRRKGYIDKLNTLEPDNDICENELVKLLTEKEYLSDFVSSHPLEHYPSPEKIGAIPIEKAINMRPGFNFSVMGMITDFKMRNRKKDGAEMGFFKLEDKTGVLDICSFTDCYEKYKKNIYDDAVVKINGNMMIDKTHPDKKKFSASSVVIISPLKNVIIVSVKDVDDWMMHKLNIVKTYVSKNGNPLIIYDKFTDELRRSDLFVSPSIVEDEELTAKMTKMRM